MPSVKHACPHRRLNPYPPFLVYVMDAATERDRQAGQIHWLLAQGERAGRSQCALMGRVAVRPRVGAVVLHLEQQVRRLPRPCAEPSAVGRAAGGLPSSDHTWPPR